MLQLVKPGEVHDVCDGVLAPHQVLLAIQLLIQHIAQALHLHAVAGW